MCEATVYGGTGCGAGAGAEMRGVGGWEGGWGQTTLGRVFGGAVVGRGGGTGRGGGWGNEKVVKHLPYNQLFKQE